MLPVMAAIVRPHTALALATFAPASYAPREHHRHTYQDNGQNRPKHQLGQHSAAAFATVELAAQGPPIGQVKGEQGANPADP